MRLLGHWWNGRTEATTRKDVLLRANPAGLFEVEYRYPGRLDFGEYPTMARARQVVAALVANGEWTRLDEVITSDKPGGH